MKPLLQFTYSAISFIVTANLSQSVSLGGTCTSSSDGNISGTCVDKCGYRTVAFDSNCDSGTCCGYVKCKEKNTGFNCMTEEDCSGYTNQGGVCPEGSKCCIHLRGSRPSPELVADNPFSSFSADNTVAENFFIGNTLSPETLNAFNVPSLAAEDNQNQNLGYLGGSEGGGGGRQQQAEGFNQQPEVVTAAIAGGGLWDDVEFSG